MTSTVATQLSIFSSAAQLPSCTASSSTLPRVLIAPSTFLVNICCSDLYNMTTSSLIFQLQHGTRHGNKFLDSTYKPCKEEAFFQCGAVQLAKKLLGQYLYCHQSKILVRILETEAYPHGDEVYSKIFGPVMYSLFQEKTGVLLQMSAGLHYAGEPYKGVVHHLYITAGGTSESRDVVFLRACEPIEGVYNIEQRLDFNENTKDYWRKNILINPYHLPTALGKEWESNPVLYKEGGVQLFHKKEDGDGPTEAKLHGKRILTKSKFEVVCVGSDDKYRFALSTEMKYNYHEREGLEKMSTD